MIEPVLRRKVLRPRGRAEVRPAGSALAGLLPRSVVRAISAGAGLTAQTGTVTDRRLPLAEALDVIDVDGFLALLGRSGQPGAGALAILDQTLFATLVEALTVGRLGPAALAPRRPTATDAALLGAVIDRLLAELDRALREAGAADPDSPGPWHLARGLTESRLLGAILDEGMYQLVDIAVALPEGAGGGLRHGQLALLLPVAGPPAQAVPSPAVAAVAAPASEGPVPGIEAVIGAAPAMLRAVLGRVVLPLDRALGLAVGQRLELPLAALEEVELVGPDGQAHATARLGQSRGMRAVRIVALDGAGPGPSPPAFAEAGPTLPVAMADCAGGE
jgi:flagellar motor switch protein FliM